MTPEHLDELERRGDSLLDEEQYRRSQRLAPTTWEHVGPAWRGRDVLVRWEEPGGIGADRKSGRPIVHRGTVVHRPFGYRLVTDLAIVSPPSFAHLVDES